MTRRAACESGTGPGTPRPVRGQYGKVAPGHRHRAISASRCCAETASPSSCCAAAPSRWRSPLLATVISWIGRLSGGDRQHPQAQYLDGSRRQDVLHPLRRHPGLLAGPGGGPGPHPWFGYKAPILPVYPWESPWKNLQMVAGPALVLGLGLAGLRGAHRALVARRGRCRRTTSGRPGPRVCGAAGRRPARPSQCDTPGDHVEQPLPGRRPGRLGRRREGASGSPGWA